MPCSISRLAALGIIQASVIMFISGAGGPPEPELSYEDVRMMKYPVVIEGNMDFALELYSNLRNEKGNIFISPHSLSTAVAMTYAGAYRETATQIADTMHFYLPQFDLHPLFKELAKYLSDINTDENSGVELAIANCLWGQLGQKYYEPFLDINQDYYDGVVERIDLSGDLESAGKKINTWVEEHTNDRIKEFIQSHDLTPATSLVLTNAIYFKADWAIQFEEKNTINSRFFLNKDDFVKVPIMSLKDKFPYFGAEGLQVIELPYAGDRLSMLIVLPDKRDGLVDIEKQLTSKLLNRWYSFLEERKVTVKLPKFKLDNRFYMEDVLSNMGMPLAFTPGKADFSGICDKPGNIWIDHIIHQTFIEINEAGTEAAAATAVTMTRGADGTIFRANHPFMFIIRDKMTRSILFMGRVTDPS